MTTVGLLVLLLATLASGQDKWSWSSNKNDRSDNSIDRYNVQSDVLAFQRPVTGGENRNDFGQGRYEVKEPTTKRPPLAKPQNDEFSGEFAGGQQSDFGLNQKFGGPINGPYNPTPFGYNPGFGGGAGNGIGYYPPQFGGAGIGGIGGGLGGGHYGGGNYGGVGNGILVGPGGPTGIIGRPYNRYPHTPYPGAGYPIGGGAGGGFPGHFGRPSFGGSGFYPNGGYPGQGGFYGGAGQFAPGHHGQFGPGPYGPLGGGLAGPFAQFDQTRQANKKIEKKSV